MKNKIYVDIMINGRFSRQLEINHCSLFKISEEEIKDKVVEKFPSLKGKNFTIEFSKNKIV